MDDDQIDRNITFAQSVVSAFGYEMVPAATIYEAFAAHSKLAEEGFTRTAAGMFCRQVDTSLIHVVKLQALKGGAYVPYSGVSLGFMPHTWKPKAKFHPTMKGARLDLFERPTSSARANRELWDIGSISSLHGDKYMSATLRSMWSDYEPTMANWFARAGSFEGCLDLAHAQAASSDWSYRTHFPSPELVHAFLLAKLGKMDAAKSELARYCAGDKDDLTLAELERALARAR